ncbi:MAG: DUF4178 domain-containing protein [Clostridiales bacterium]|nr:DUF4178 domain-containing protein [Clostridiales bacterium]
MEYAVGNVLRVDGDICQVIGRIQYRNLDDNCRWDEYRLRQKSSGRELWLSYDDAYNEYSLSWVTGKVSKEGYHEVDRGTEEVLGVWGKVDVEVGDRAAFYEYEDSTEEKIISVEVWDDGEETSCGYYLDWDEVSLCREPDGSAATASSEAAITKLVSLFVGMIAFIVIGAVFLTKLSGGKDIADYLKENTAAYTYVTSITGNNKEKADVYRSAYDLDTTVRDILDGIEGQTEDVQQNTEDGDNSVGILTEKEYCLVYESEENEILVQICTRKYAYTTDSTPYHARTHTGHYFRRYYYTRGYAGDMGSFGNYTSPYSSFDDGTIDDISSDPYNTYSSSVRQSSINNRTSSGGGISSGK